jgi:primosomal protein N' (replication factor Y)
MTHLVTGESPPAPLVASVLTPVALESAYSYLVPDGMRVVPGSIVRVPLGPREIVGCVWEVGGEAGTTKRLRAISHVFDAPPIAEPLRDFVDWVARYTLTARGMILRMVLRAPEALEPEAPMRGVALGGPPPERLTPARRRVLEALEDAPAWTRTGLAAAAGVSPGVVDGLIASGTLMEVSLTRSSYGPAPDPDFAAPTLTPDQATGATELRARIGAGFSVSLIDGVTGSGKTEVYLEAVAECLRKGRQALVLVPEIALTQAFLERFAERFGARPAEWHSDVTPRNRARTWRAAATGEVSVVVGARSALYLPFRDLGLIAVDEEHDAAYKQEEWASYNARDMAVVRARLSDIPLVLASATPSLETQMNVAWGRYHAIRLPERASGAAMPEIRLVDMRRYPPERGRWLSPPLVRAVEEAVGRGEQALLFLNRRGYAPLTLCRACGHRFQCPNCSTWLVDHRFRGTLECHQCGHVERRPESCPSCGALDSLVSCGPGVERIAEEVHARWPGFRTVVMSSDMTGGVQRQRLEFAEIEKGNCDIVIGTQLVAKGHNFPGLSLVGVIDADIGLQHGDLRAAERTFQLLAQVTGRAGRLAGKGRGLIQTYAPEHPVMAAIASGDRERFYGAETEAREMAGMPPFGRLASLVVSAPEKTEAHAYARALARAAPVSGDIAVLGPAEAPLSILRGRHRFRLLVHGARASDMQGFLRGWLGGAPKALGGVKLQVDVDPQSFL